MNIKTITSEDSEVFDNMVKGFNKMNIVKFTQTHVNFVEGKLLYTAICFFEGDEK